MQVRGGKGSCQARYFVPDTCVVSEAQSSRERVSITVLEEQQRLGGVRRAFI